MSSSNHHRTAILTAVGVAAVGLALAATLTRGTSPPSALASSHSEAPLIGQDPRADNTDLYAFVSPDRPGTVTMIANYIPLQPPASGPNFASFDDTVAYDINIDSNGDGAEDLTYRFRFTTQTRNPNTFLYNVGPITSLSDPNWNRPQTYAVSLIKHGPGGSTQETVLGSNIPTPPDNVGPRSTPNYDALAAAAVTTLSDGKTKVFAGQRDDAFFVDLGSVFDLAGLRPFNPFHAIPLLAEPGRDALAHFNVHSIEIQVPIDQVVKIPNTTFGVYASASRSQVRILDANGQTKNQGNLVQVSRLGEPLINEAVIPLGKKDLWNRLDPVTDSQFESLYLNPEVTRLENLLYGSVLQPARTTGRTDLVAILLTGVPGLNFTGPHEADLLRLNTALTPKPNGACYANGSNAAPSRLGVLEGDLCGFPNGRRLADDIVDIDLRAFADGYGAFLNSLLGLPNLSPNNQLGDGVDANDKPFLAGFPYEASPSQGYEVP